jgi:hypothetical protein
MIRKFPSLFIELPITLAVFTFTTMAFEMPGEFFVLGVMCATIVQLTSDIVRTLMNEI